MARRYGGWGAAQSDRAGQWSRYPETLATLSDGPLDALPVAWLRIRHNRHQRRNGQCARSCDSSRS